MRLVSGEDVWKRELHRRKHTSRREGTGLRLQESTASLAKSALDRAGSLPSRLVLKAVGCRPAPCILGWEVPGPGTRLQPAADVGWPLLAVGLRSSPWRRYTCLAATCLWAGAP